MAALLRKQTDTEWNRYGATGSGGFNTEYIVTRRALAQAQLAALMHTMKISAQCIARTLPQIGVFGAFGKIVKSVLLYSIFEENNKSFERGISISKN